MVDDIKKLRPELLDKSDAELDRLANEIALAKEYKRREAEIAAKESLALEANKHIDAIVAGVKFLHDNGLLSEKVASGFSRSDGMFSPSMYLRNVTADMLVGGTKPDKPKQKRNRRTKTELEAARAAGEPVRKR